MTTKDLGPFERAIATQLCTRCAEGGAGGACCRPGGQPCALKAHVDVIVEAITRLGRGRTADEYSRAFERSMCPVCVSDVTGYCSLLELVIERPDAYLLRIVDIVMDVEDALRREQLRRPPAR